MSELDADLYGDLYGNDEAEFGVPTNQAEEPSGKDTQETQEHLKEPSPGPATVASSQPPEESQPTPSPPAQKPSSSQPSPQDVTSYNSQPTQQIPTYQERTESDYNDQMTSRSAGFSTPVDRPVRPSEMKEEGKMFIGGLNWDTTDEGLRKYFSQFGKVEACTIMRDAAGRSRCFAFLTFEDPASVNAVMVREHYLDGKIIDPKRAIPRQEHQRATKLFIGGLPGTVTSESMREFFSQFGKVVDATVMLDRETGRSKGFGFVSFEGANVEPILGFGNLEIDGKLIDVKLAQPRSQRENFSEGGANTSNNSRAQSAYGTGNYSGQQGQYNASAGGGPGNASGHAPFDPQALASLYTRMMQQMSMNQMMGGMPVMAGGTPGGFAGGMSGGIRMPGMAAGGMGPAMGGMGAMGAMGSMGNGSGMGVGRGGAAGAGPGNMMGGVPRGPRGAPTGPSAAGVGPQRAGQRGQHSHGYHPYAR